MEDGTGEESKRKRQGKKEMQEEQRKIKPKRVLVDGKMPTSKNFAYMHK